jgi:hypothetical protein
MEKVSHDARRSDRPPILASCLRENFAQSRMNAIPKGFDNLTA